MRYILILLLFIACNGKEEKKEEVKEKIIPKSALFVIQDLPEPVAYKTDTAQPWVILDSAAALKVLLKSVEDNYNRAMEMNRREQEKLNNRTDTTVQIR